MDARDGAGIVVGRFRGFDGDLCRGVHRDQSDGQIIIANALMPGSVLYTSAEVSCSDQYAS